MSSLIRKRRIQLLCPYEAREYPSQEGDAVKQGQPIGQIGFAGDAFIPHLHYMLIERPDILKAESLPSYFRDFRQVIGSRSVHVERGQRRESED